MFEEILSSLCSKGEDMLTNHRPLEIRNTIYIERLFMIRVISSVIALKFCSFRIPIGLNIFSKNSKEGQMESVSGEMSRF